MEWIKLYDSSGKEIMAREEPNQEITLELNQLKAGIYFLKVSSQNQINLVKLIKI